MSHPTVYNPFNITKAVDYTDNQINQAWVDLPSGEGKFTDMVKPTMPMPMLILGGKGSGKTHIMRYFSYGLQKIRYGDQLKANLKHDRYVGIYMRCGGLNAKRFSSKGVPLDQWLRVFSYYMELWLSQLVIDALQDILFELGDETSFSEDTFVSSLLELFDKPVTLQSNSLAEFKKFLNTIQKSVDYEINQLSLSRGNIYEKIEVLITDGRLIFGIPKLIEQQIPYFSEFQFLYLIDEYENLEEYHQKYFNTLIREKEAPATFRVGVRLYGIKTYETFSGGESIKEGSEYELFNIDTFFRNNNGYYKFMVEICQRRLELSGYPSYSRSFEEHFEEFSLVQFNKTLSEIDSKNSLSHFGKLRTKLKQSRYKDDFIDSIINNLEFKDDLLLERTNVFLFYRSWKEVNSKKFLIDSSLLIKKDADLYFKDIDRSRTKHHTVLDKFKTDLIDQLCRENGIDFPYYGFENFVTMSSGIPRVLLKTLKEIFKQSYFNGEKPFLEGKISRKSQLKGLKISSDWFIEDASPTGGNSTKQALIRIGDFLREIKFSDLPPECSISIFSINNSYIRDTSAQVLTLLENYSYIIDVSERRDKNGNTINQTYQINGIIAPRWELSINRRGVISINRDEVEAIFGENSSAFYDIIERRVKRYNHPLSTNFTSPTLFDNEPN